MATIVVHKTNGARYVVVGSGYGAWESKSPSFWWGNLAPTISSGGIALVAVCDERGEIGWLPSHELLAVEIDGKSPQAWLEPTSPYR